jgi:hypothetical protein
MERLDKGVRNVQDVFKPFTTKPSNCQTLPSKPWSIPSKPLFVKPL